MIIKGGKTLDLVQREHREGYRFSGASVIAAVLDVLDHRWSAPAIFCNNRKKDDVILLICCLTCLADFAQPFLPEIKTSQGHNSRAFLPPINHILLLWLSTCRGLGPFQSFLIESMKQIM